MSEVIRSIQKIYPDIKGGFVYWETKQDGSKWDDPLDGLIWNNTEYNKPTWSEIESYLYGVNLEIKRVKLKDQLKIIRNNNFSSTITHAKGEFSASEGAYTKLSAIVAAWNGSTSELWRDVDNNMVSLTKTECKEILRAIKDAHTPIYVKEGVVAIQIDNETDLATLENFDVQAAWDAA